MSLPAPTNQEKAPRSPTRSPEPNSVGPGSLVGQQPGGHPGQDRPQHHGKGRSQHHRRNSSMKTRHNSTDNPGFRRYSNQGGPRYQNYTNRHAAPAPEFYRGASYSPNMNPAAFVPPGGPAGGPGTNGAPAFPQFNPQFAPQFVPSARGGYPNTYAAPVQAFQPATATYPPKRVVLSDAQGHEITDLRAHRAHIKETGGSPAPAPAPSAPASSNASSASPVPATATPTAPASSSAGAPAPEFKKAAPISDAAQKMREMIEKKRQLKAQAEGKAEPSEIKTDPKDFPKEPKAEAKPVPTEPKVESKPEPKQEPEESKPEPKPEPVTATPAEPKETEPKPAETKETELPAAAQMASEEPKPEEPKEEGSLADRFAGKWVPPHLRAQVNAEKKAKAEGKSVAEVTEEAKAVTPPAAETKEAKPVEEPKEPVAEPKEEAKEEPKEEAKEEETKPKDEKPKEDPAEVFLRSLSHARPLTPAEMSTFKYPPSAIVHPNVEDDKVRYMHGFLLQFSSMPRAYYASIKATTGLPDFDSGVDRWSSGMTSGRGGSSRGPSRSSSAVNFSNRAPPRSGRDASVRGRNGSRRRGDRNGSRRDRDEPQVNLADLPPLRTVENAWKPSFMKKEDDKDDEEEDGRLSPEEVQRKVKSLLNKLAWENFDKIVPQIRDIALQSRKEHNAITVRQIVQLIFEKATDEAHWSAVYAGLFFYMHQGEGLLPDDIVDNTDPEKPVRGLAVLRRYLLSMAQMEFEKGWADAKDITNYEVMSDEYYQAVNLKRRGLGLIQFIGELYKTGLIRVGLVAQCILRLSQQEPAEDVVESLARLVKTIAPKLLQAGEEQTPAIRELESQLDAANANLGKTRSSRKPEAAVKAAEETVQEVEHKLAVLRQSSANGLLDKAMQILVGWRTSGKLPARLRFQVMDMEDLAKKKWVGVEDNGPKTIAQVHMEAAIKAQEEEKEKMRSRQSSRRGGDFRSMSNRRR